MAHIKIVNANKSDKFVTFLLDNDPNPITVGLTWANLNVYEQSKSLTIAYQGEVVKIPFDAKSEDLVRINKENSTKYPTPTLIDSHLRLLQECGLKDLRDYDTFMSVCTEHCFSKGIYDIDTVRSTWLEFKEKLEEVVHHLKDFKVC